MTDSAIQKKADEIQRLLSDNGIGASVECGFGSTFVLPIVDVYIEWGDWKHSHCRAKYLVEQNVAGAMLINSKATEEDGSDCFSAVHRFMLTE